MISPPITHRTLRLASALAGIALWLGANSAQASTLSAGPAHGAPGHRCKCGMDCGDTCCCAPSPKVAKPLATRPSPAPRPRPSSAPCLTKAPCGGDAGMPDAPPSARISKAAALMVGLRLAPPATGARPSLPTSPRPANPSPTPPFEPPEIPGRVA